MTGTGGFSKWFLQLYQSKKVTLSCPDSMVYADGHEELSTKHDEWLDLVKEQQVIMVCADCFQESIKVLLKSLMSGNIFYCT